MFFDRGAWMQRMRLEICQANIGTAENAHPVGCNSDTLSVSCRESDYPCMTFGGGQQPCGLSKQSEETILARIDMVTGCRHIRFVNPGKSLESA
jgi:hypothetical protein